MFHEIYHIPPSPLCPPTWGDTWLKTWDELIYCKKQIWLRWSSLHLWSTNPFLSLDNQILDHCKYPSSFSSPLFLFQLKSLIEAGSPERAAGFLPPGGGNLNKEGSITRWSIYWCGQSDVLWPIMVQFSFSISSSGNSLPGTTCSLDRLLPPWTWCQRRGFWALLRLCKPWDEVPGPLTNTECWILMLLLNTDYCQMQVQTPHLWKVFPRKEDSVGEHRLSSWTAYTSILPCPLWPWPSGPTTLSQRT